MILVPHTIMDDYVAILKNHEISSGYFEQYKKWLRYFYDFNSKILDTSDKPEKVKLFLEKLRSKNQTQEQCQQAAHAVSLYFEMQSQANFHETPGKEATNKEYCADINTARHKHHYSTSLRKAEKT